MPMWTDYVSYTRIEIEKKKHVLLKYSLYDDIGDEVLRTCNT